MDWLEMFLLGFVSGLTEFMPISASGHQGLLLYMLGQQDADPLYKFFITVGALAAVITACRSSIRRLLAERAITQRRAKRGTYAGKHYDYPFLKTAAVPIILSTFLIAFFPVKATLPVLVLGFLINGLILFIPGNMRQGNKDARHMTRLESLFAGVCGALSVIPGISRVGAVASACIGFGAQRERAISWSYLISIPVLAVRAFFEFISIFALGTTLGVVGFLFAIFGGVLAFAGARMAIRLIRFVAVHIGISGFSYYTWGMAMLTFILFLIT